MILHLKAAEAKDVPNLDMVGKSDPYLTFELTTSPQVWKTKTIQNSLTPKWNQIFHLPITPRMEDVLTISLYDEDEGKKDDFISQKQFTMQELQFGQLTDQWYAFTPGKGVKKGGNVRLIFHLDKHDKDSLVV